MNNICDIIKSTNRKKIKKNVNIAVIKVYFRPKYQIIGLLQIYY